MNAPRFYHSNPTLKRAGFKIDFTPEQIQEYIKCTNDPIYFVETYMKIVHVDRGLINFKLYDWQVEMINAMKNERFCAFCVARQGGKSIAVGAFLLWYILFHPLKMVGLLANKGDTAQEILGRIENAYQTLPIWLTQGVIEWNKRSFVLENGSKIIAAATSDANVRGFTFNMIYLDEVAHVERYEEFAASVLPTVSSGQTTKVIMTSTPFGLNHFYKTIELGRRPKDSPDYNGYYVMEVPWNRVPGRDEAWKKKTMEMLNYDQEKFEQEFNIQFLGSSGTLIAGWKLKELVFKIPISETVDGLKQYVRPEKGHRYMMVCDTSEGKGMDYSAFQVVDITEMPYDQVCTFRSNMITPQDFASFIHGTALTYNDAFVLPEVTTLGEEVGNALLWDFEYANLLMTGSGGRAGKRLCAGFGSGKQDKGVRTTKLVKQVGCSMLKLLVEQNQLMIHDFATIEEFCRFSRKNTSFEAEEGSTDDLTMCLVLFGWATNQPLFKELSDIHTLDKLRELNEEQVLQDMIPFGFVDGGHEGDVRDDGDLPDNWLLM